MVDNHVSQSVAVERRLTIDCKRLYNGVRQLRPNPLRPGGPGSSPDRCTRPRAAARRLRKVPQHRQPKTAHRIEYPVADVTEGNVTPRGQVSQLQPAILARPHRRNKVSSSASKTAHAHQGNFINADVKEVDKNHTTLPIAAMTPFF